MSKPPENLPFEPSFPPEEFSQSSSANNDNSSQFSAADKAAGFSSSQPSVSASSSEDQSQNASSASEVAEERQVSAAKRREGLLKKRKKNILGKKKRPKQPQPKGAQGETLLIMFGLLIAVAGIGSAFIYWAEDILFLQLIAAIFRNFWWLILTPVVWFVFDNLWGEYRVLRFVIQQKYVLLEIVLPPDVERSPKIMEQVFHGLWSFSSVNKLEKYCGWKPMQNKYSFEVASLEGSVHFYIKCTKSGRDNVEAQIYAQYPTAEIFEVEDYTKKVPLAIPNKQWDLWGTTMDLWDHPAVPIRTYRHFIEDVTGKMIDPLASLTEVFSTFGKDQYAWFQVIFTPEVEPDWQPEYQEYLNGILEKYGAKVSEVGKPGVLGNFFSELAILPTNVVKSLYSDDLSSPGGASSGEEGGEGFNINKLPPGEQDKLKAISDNMGKTVFKTAIRYIYVGKVDNFNKAVGVAGPLGALKQYAIPNLNSLFADNKTKTFANYYFQNTRATYRKRKILQNYRDRDFSGAGFHFNTEALASVFHFPDMNVTAAGLRKVEAKKGQAPTNVPGSVIHPEFS
jgi:hypothetical protein